MLGLLHYKFLAWSPETTLHHQNQQAANYNQQITGVTDTSPSKRHYLGMTYRREDACQGQAKKESPTAWGTGHVGRLQESCSVSENSTPLHSKPGLDNTLLRSFATSLLSAVTGTYGMKLSILFQISKIVQSSVLKTQLLFPLQVLPKEEFFLPWRQSIHVSAVLLKQIPGFHSTKQEQPAQNM